MAMSFIRAKEIPPRSGNWYDYEVRTVHEGKRVIQEHPNHLRGLDDLSHGMSLQEREDHPVGLICAFDEHAMAQILQYHEL